MFQERVCRRVRLLLGAKGLLQSIYREMRTTSCSRSRSSVEMKINIFKNTPKIVMQHFRVQNSRVKLSLQIEHLGILELSNFARVEATHCEDAQVHLSNRQNNSRTNTEPSRPDQSPQSQPPYLPIPSLSPTKPFKYSSLIHSFSYILFLKIG